MSGLNFLGALRKRRDMDLAAFSDHFTTVHRAYMMPFAGDDSLRGYIQNIRIPDDVDGLVSDLDGSPELWFRSGDALAEIAAQPAFQEAVSVDTPLFVDMPPRSSLVQREVVLPGAGRAALADAVKLMLFLDAGDEAAASAAWRSRASIVLPSATPLRLERNLAVADQDGNVPFFGCETSWWPDRARLAEAWKERMSADDLMAAGFSGMSILVAREHVAIQPPD